MRWNTVFILAAAVYFLGNLFWVVFGSTAVQPWNTPAGQQDEEGQEGCPGARPGA